MHMYFGNLAKIRRVIYYRLSPYEIKSKTSLSQLFIRFKRSYMDSLFIVGLPLAFTGVLIQMSDAENLRLSRKNPKDFDNDV